MTVLFDTRPAAYAVIIRNSAILLAYWKQDGKEGWTLPGGRAGPGRAPGWTAVSVRSSRRRATTPEIGAMLGIDVGHWPAGSRLDGADRDFQALRLVYEARVTGRGAHPRRERHHHARRVDTAARRRLAEQGVPGGRRAAAVTGAPGQRQTGLNFRPRPGFSSQPAPRWLFWGVPGRSVRRRPVWHELRAGEVDLMIAEFVCAPRPVESTLIIPAPAAAHP
jgi:hypothetical protein